MRKIRDMKKSTRAILMGIVILVALGIAMAIDALLSPFDIHIGSAIAAAIVILYILYSQL